ncbi:MAG: hypothetical protein EPO68_05195 [Planctomycetota bacterium]|nr:MAG: hypothetical protein EPO68_05195 [Planctomycetota bacterium]
MGCRSLLFVALACVLGSCSKTLGRAPGPETPRLIGETSGTLLLGPSGEGALNREYVLLDLPSLATRSFTLDDDAQALSGIDEQGRLVYLDDARDDASVDSFVDHMLMRSRKREPSAIWKLRLYELDGDSDQAFLDLDRHPDLISLSPRGGMLIVADADVDAAGAPHDAARSRIRCIDLATRATRPLELDIGRVRACHWKADGSACALDGTTGGALVLPHTAQIVATRAGGYGPFTPDHSAFLAPRGDAHALIELTGERVIADPARFPYPHQYSGTPHETGPVDPLALPTPRLALYHALPTAGQPTRRSIGRGGYWSFEHPAIKVCDLLDGTYATVWSGDTSTFSPHYTPIRLLEPPR